MEELKPCPWCGEQPETWWDFNVEFYEEGYNIKCCYVYINRSYKAEAIEAWNTRKE